MKEITIISGKGGTGKTSIVASFAALAENKILADCDVDAADLHLVLNPRVKYTESYSGSKAARIDPEKCTECGLCRDLCRFDAIGEDFVVYGFSCEGCGLCYNACPEGAVLFEDRKSGDWYISETDYGPMVHAKLGIAEENSGKLVSVVRGEARRIAEEKNLDLIIVDGSPGIGCPVIASVTGSDLLLVITEPTLSGIHDLERVVKLADHFDIPVLVCVNKYDINEEMTDRIAKYCEENNRRLAGKIPYDAVVTKAQIAGVSVVEYSSSKVSKEIEKLWRHVCYNLPAESTA